MCTDKNQWLPLNRCGVPVCGHHDTHACVMKNPIDLPIAAELELKAQTKETVCAHGLMKTDLQATNCEISSLRTRVEQL